MDGYRIIFCTGNRMDAYRENLLNRFKFKMKSIPTSGFIWENTTKVKKRWDWCKLAHTHYTPESLWLLWKKKICDEKQLQLLYITTSIELLLLLNYRINMFNASLTWPHILVSISWHYGITQLLHLILRDISCIDKQIITDWYCIQNPVAFVSNLNVYSFDISHLLSHF